MHKKTFPYKEGLLTQLTKVRVFWLKVYGQLKTISECVDKNITYWNFLARIIMHLGAKDYVIMRAPHHEIISYLNFRTGGKYIDKSQEDR